MYKKYLALFVISMALPAPALAGSNINDTLKTNAFSLETLQAASPSNSASKSKRQKCLDMMLPQDGVKCLKKLKAKNK